MGPWVLGFSVQYRYLVDAAVVVGVGVALVAVCCWRRS